MYGFVFAFCEFSRLGHPSLMERAVRAVSRSDSIHVAVVPAALDRAVRRVGIVGEAAYTAFMGCGVVAQPVDQVLTRCYCYSFLPVRGGDAALFRDGVRFLRGMVGVRYNRRVRGPRLHAEAGRARSLLQPAGAHAVLPHGQPARVPGPRGLLAVRARAHHRRRSPVPARVLPRVRHCECDAEERMRHFRHQNRII